MNAPAASADSPLAFVDVETTGGHPASHRVTEVAIVAMRGGEIEWEWSTLVHPGIAIPPSIQALTGISNEMVADAPPFAALAREVRERLEGRLFVAHNARFDYGFLRAELRRAGHEFAAPLVCTVRLSRLLYPDGGRHNLDSLIARHGLVCDSRHRALPDAQVLAQFWRMLRGAWPAAELDAAIARVSRRPTLPAQLPPDLLDELPEGPGVYRFLGEEDALIYVGKAVNLRERVLAHFAGATRDAKSERLAAQVRRVQWQETAGELGALLLEARLVRELQPVYNRRLRGRGANWTWSFADGDSAPRLVDLDAHPLGAADAFGLYPSERQARSALLRLAREARLCLRVLGLEAGGAGSCFGYQVGRCAGACVGAEPLSRHAIRAKLALARLKLRSWPWPGPVGVQERSALGLQQLHVVDRWQYLGTLTRGGEHALFAPRPGFDADAYRILVRHLRPGARNLRPLPRGVDPQRLGFDADAPGATAGFDAAAEFAAAGEWPA